jgi:hypothetical protein
MDFNRSSQPLFGPYLEWTLSAYRRSYAPSSWRQRAFLGYLQYYNHTPDAIPRSGTRYQQHGGPNSVNNLY